MTTASSEAQSLTAGARHARRVTLMRAHWHREAVLAASGDAAGAEREKARGDAVFDALLTDLGYMLQQKANAYLRDKTLIQDGVHEQIVSLYEKLRDLSGDKSAAGWEIPAAFWTCFHRHASNVFLRAVQRDYGKKRLAARDADGKTDTVPSEQNESETGGADGYSPFDALADEGALKPFAALFHADLLREIIASIPNPKHRDALLLECAGVPQAEIARRLGISPKSVYNYIAAGRKAALRWAREYYDKHGEYAHWSAKPLS